ncbi:MAG TPA: LPS export ABC transporter periplasmic protein LptC [Spirochaetia bacterium]|nr:LPS export ABC transporter periplasmic protein LptC [Spirochaetia bacterium]
MSRSRSRPQCSRGGRSVRVSAAFSLVCACSALALSISGCSLNYRAAEVAQKLEANVPDLIFYNFQHTSFRHNRKTFQISAEVSKSFDQKKSQELTGIQFLEYNDSGEVITRGNADSAILYTDSDNVQLSGHISFYSKQEQATIGCSSLFWNDKARTLTSGAKEVVTIRKDSGTELTGTGFFADAARNEVRFSGPVSGTVVVEDKGGAK